MSRSIWKKPFSSLNSCSLLELWRDDPLSNENSDESSYNGDDNKKKRSNLLYQNQIKTQQKPIEVWSRNSMVLPEHLRKNVKIYNGKNWAFRKIVEQIDRKSTRLNSSHSGESRMPSSA